MLLGVEAPAVRPTTTRPSAGSQCSVDHFGRCGCRRRADRAMPDPVRRKQAARIGDVIGAHARRADPRQVAGVAAVVAADHDHQIERLARRAALSTASCRSCVALQIVSNARKCCAQRVRRRSGRASRRRTSRRSPATRTSASSSGWRSRRGPGRGRDRNPATPRRRSAPGTPRGRRRGGCSRTRTAASSRSSTTR